MSDLRLSRTPLVVGLDFTVYGNFYEMDRAGVPAALARARAEKERRVFVGVALIDDEVDEHLLERVRDAGVEAVSTVLARLERKRKAPKEVAQGRRRRKKS